MNNCKRYLSSILVCRARYPNIQTQNFHCAIKHVKKNITSNKCIHFFPQASIYNTIRFKSKKQQYDSDDEDNVIVDDDASLSKDSKVVKFSTTSMRTDVILKSALAISRNKIEQAFYESKIRVNGKKIMKKSAPVRVGDEIDIVKIVSPKNPDHLYVTRVEVLNVAPKEESISVSARRFKNLLIENYEENPYKGTSESEI